VNWSRAWVIARKDLADALESRFLMATVILLPFLFAVVIPVTTLVPLSTLPTRTTPLSIGVGGENPVAGLNLTNAYLVNDSVNASRLENSSLNHAFVGNSTLVNTIVVNSVLYNVTLVNSVVKDSNLYQCHSDARTDLIDSIIVGAPSTFETATDTVLQFYLIFFILIPVIIPAAMASYTIIGEKTNRSLEPLLASPLSSRELLAGKVIAIFIPCVLSTWGSFAAFAVLVWATLTRLTGHSNVPNTTWYLTILLVAPLVAILSIALNVIVSSRVSDIRVSQQLGSLVILPILLFFLGGFSGLFFLGPTSVLILAAIVAVADMISFQIASQLFNREEVLLRWK
jgi:ABC-2 type transport system permease protein